MLTINEVAKRLTVSRDTIRRMIDRGELVAIKVGLRQWRIEEAELERYIARQQGKVLEASSAHATKH